MKPPPFRTCAFFPFPSQPIVRYYQQLVRFQRVAVPAGTTVTATLPLKVSDLAAWNDQQGGYLPGKRGWSLGRPGETAIYTLMAGLHAAECGVGGAGPAGCDLPSTTIQIDVPAE
jgi:hypothetical protein